MKYDVLIPVGKRDVARVGFCVESLRWLDPQPDSVTVVTPDPALVPRLDRPGVRVVRDSDVLDLERVGPQGNWVFQQFIKLFQGVTENSLYMTVDSDLVFLRPFKVFADDGRPLFWRFPLAGAHGGFQSFMRDAWGLEGPKAHSMVCHMMMFDRKFVQEMLDVFVRLHPCPEGMGRVEHLYRYAAERSCDKWCISEYESYASYMEARHPGVYGLKGAVCFELARYCSVDVGFVAYVVAEALKISADVVVVHCRMGKDSF